MGGIDQTSTHTGKISRKVTGRAEFESSAAEIDRKEVVNCT